MPCSTEVANLPALGRARFPEPSPPNFTPRAASDSCPTGSPKCIKCSRPEIPW